MIGVDAERRGERGVLALRVDDHAAPPCETERRSRLFTSALLPRPTCPATRRFGFVTSPSA